MIADTVYPIIQALEMPEQIKLFERLKKDLQLVEKPKKPSEMTEEEIEVQKFEKWFKSKLYPPRLE